MTKEQFLAELRRRIGYLPEEEIEKPLKFYAESIDDRIEDGMSEEEAVAAMGSMDDIVHEFENSLPLTTIVRQKVNNRTRKSDNSVIWIILAVLGFPLWFPLLLAAGAVVLAVIVTITALGIGLLAAVFGLAVAAVVTLAYGAFRVVKLGIYGALMVVGAAAILLGLAFLLAVPVRAIARWLGSLLRRFWRWLKRLVIGKEGLAK